MMKPSLLLIALLATAGCGGSESDGDEATGSEPASTEDDENSDDVWVMKNDGNVIGPTCQDVCEGALS